VTTILAGVNRNPGSFVTDAFDVPTDATGIRVSIDRSFLDNVKRNDKSEDPLERIVAEIFLERSVDGVKWEVASGMGIEGGPSDATWNPSGKSTLFHRFPPRWVGKPFKLRGRYKINTRLKARVDVEWDYGPALTLTPIHHSVAITDLAHDEINDATNLTLGSTAATGSNTLAVFVGANAYSAGRSYTSVTRGGSEVFTELQDEVWGTNQGHGAHYYADPDSSAATTVIVHSSTCVASGCVYYMSGVHGTPIDDSLVKNSTSGTSISDTLTSQTDGMCVACCQVYSAPDLAPTESGQTEDAQYDQYAGGPQIYQNYTRRASAGATTVMGNDWTGSDYNDLVAVAVAPLAAAGGIEVLRRRREE
jgi:hypothetical protein